MDVELMEAKRQRRKLNFLITQTELYAHFMQRKLNEDGEQNADRILRQLDEDRDPRLASIDNYDRYNSSISFVSAYIGCHWLPLEYYQIPQNSPGNQEYLERFL